MDFYYGLAQIVGVHTLLGLSAYIVLLTGQVTRPVRAEEDDAAHAGRLVDEIDDFGDDPFQSSVYLCSRHGSP